MDSMDTNDNVPGPAATSIEAGLLARLTRLERTSCQWSPERSVG